MGQMGVDIAVAEIQRNCHFQKLSQHHTALAKH